MPILITELVKKCCGNCSKGHGTSNVIYSIPKASLDEVKESIAGIDTVHMSFPINGKETDDEYQGKYYRPLFSSPGVAVLVMSEDPNESAKAMLQSVISAWPVLLLTLVMAWLSGIVMWTLVSTHFTKIRPLILISCQDNKFILTSSCIHSQNRTSCYIIVG